MKPRKRYLSLAAMLATAVVVVPAIASSEPSPTVSGLESIMWSPAEVTVASGGTVSFQDTSGSVPHGIVWESGNPETPTCSGVPINEGKTDWKGSCTFTTAGTYKYYCYVHGMAMSGTIDVSSLGTTTTSTTTPVMTSTGGGATTTSPTTSTGKAGAGEATGSPLAGGAQAIELARSQHGKSVRGSVHVSQAGVGALLEVELFTGGAAPVHSKNPARTRAGRLVHSSLKEGDVSFSVPLTMKAQVALRRHHRLAITVKIMLTPLYGAAVVVTRIVVVHA